jgi:putative transposase
MVDAEHDSIPVKRQCELLGLPRSSFYYEPAPWAPEDLELMELIDKQFTKTPFYGRRRMTEHLRQYCGKTVDCKRVRGLYRVMGLEAVYAKPRLSQAQPGHKVYPYLLRGVAASRPNHVWSTDITYVRMQRGFLYLVAILDWYSRFVLAWELSNTLEASFCVEALSRALAAFGTPEVFNTDQGAQFTSDAFTSVLLAHSVRISMDGRGRALDNVFVERLWRSVKYEEIFLNDYTNGLDAYKGLGRYFRFYNDERPHQALGYQTPRRVYSAN